MLHKIIIQTCLLAGLVLLNTRISGESWEEAYLEYLESFEYRNGCTYSFIYVDDDAIPELEINTGYAAGGSLLLTYHDGILDEVDIYRSGLYYVEKGNLICRTWNMARKLRNHGK